VLRSPGTTGGTHSLDWRFSVDRIINAPDTDSVAFERACHDDAWGCAYSRVWRAYLDVIREERSPPPYPPGCCTVWASMPATTCASTVARAGSGIFIPATRTAATFGECPNHLETTWLNNHDLDVFFVGTCNDASKLPPEFAIERRVLRAQKDTGPQQVVGHEEAIVGVPVPAR
jgi:hypothetical protein